MKNILLLLLILAIAPFSLKAKNIKHGKEIKLEKLILKHMQNKKNLEATPCCLVIAQNSQAILFNLYDEGMASCFDSVCTAFWIAFENAGEQNIENSLASCEAGDPNFQCTNN